MSRRKYRWRRLFGVVVLAAVGWGVLRMQYVPPVLMYHRIDDQSQVTKLSVSPESFARHMKFLDDWGYRVLQLNELAQYVQSGTPVPPRSVVITFDDGFDSVFTEAFPVLRQHAVPATVFVITDRVGEPGYLTWEQIQEMSEHGITIGSHTRQHAFLTSLDEVALRDELAESKRVLQAQVDASIEWVSYPLGNYDIRVQQAARAAGYVGAVATNPGPSAADDDLFALKRIRISRTSDSLLTFALESSGFYTMIKEWRDDD